MKLPIIAVAILATFQASAQLTRGVWEISAGFGRVSGADVLESFTYDPDASLHETFYRPVMHVSGKYYPSIKGCIGFTVGVHQLAGLKVREYSNDTTRYSMMAYAVALESKKVYYSYKESFQLYGVLGVGGFLGGELSYSFYGCPLGISVGRKHAFFLEAGFGYKGMISAGYSYRFLHNAGL